MKLGAEFLRLEIEVRHSGNGREIMDSQQFADLELKTIISLAGMPVQKDLVNPRKPLEMAKRVRVTFRPLPRNYGNQIVIKFREKLEIGRASCRERV